MTWLQSQLALPTVKLIKLKYIKNIENKLSSSSCPYSSCPYSSTKYYSLLSQISFL
jgi:hypothetical protein